MVLAAAGLVSMSATTAAEETSNVLETTIRADYFRKVILRLPPVQLTAGRARYLYGYYAGTGSPLALVGSRCGVAG